MRGTMKQILASALIATFAVSPAFAEEEKSQIERGLELFLDGLREELSPNVEELREMARQFGPAMQSFIEEMGPAFAEMMGEVRDWSRYDMPEMLPNGDIIIRRKPDPEPAPPEENAEGDADAAIDI